MKAWTHIVPAVPPAFNGLGDYARMLHASWPDPKPEWNVVALNIPEGAEAAWPGVRFFEAPSGAGFAEKLLEMGAPVVALHYVSHGYSPHGIASWLPVELEKWKKASGGTVVVFFHETLAFSPPWKKPFWRWPASRATLQKLGSLADGALTSNPLYVWRLRTFARLRIPIQVAPVGPNIPALAHAEPHSVEGGVRVAVFGLPRTRRKTLAKYRPFLEALQNAKRLEGLSLIGASMDEKDREAASFITAPIDVLSDGTEEEVSRALARCHVSLVSTPRPMINKSGVFAAACSHRLIPVVVTEEEGPYLAVNVDQPDGAVAALFDASKLEGIRQRVSGHAAASDWKAIATAWKRAMGEKT